MVQRLLMIVLGFISLHSFSQENTAHSESRWITLEQFVADVKAKNESIRNEQHVNVMVNDLLIENTADYKIDPSNILKMEILVLEPKVSDRRTNPSIIITTKRK